MSSSTTDQRIVVWDLPVRVLHASFAFGLTVALVLGFTVDDDHPLFAYHVLAGMFAGGAVVLRVLWGLIGPGHARFTRWPLSPAALARQINELVAVRRETEFVGHNPLAAWVMLGLLAVAAALVVTGVSGGDDIHEGLAVALAIGIGLHLAGLVIHRWRHGENLAPSMLDGRKRGPASASLRHPQVLAGAACAVALALWAGALFQGLDPQARVLRLPLGLPAVDLHGESHEREHSHSRGHHREHDDD